MGIRLKKLICKIFGHYMHSPWGSSNYRTNHCLRCNYTNERYDVEGYFRGGKD